MAASLIELIHRALDKADRGSADFWMQIIDEAFKLGVKSVTETTCNEHQWVGVGPCPRCTVHPSGF